MVVGVEGCRWSGKPRRDFACTYRRWNHACNLIYRPNRLKNIGGEKSLRRLRWYDVIMNIWDGQSDECLWSCFFLYIFVAASVLTSEQKQEDGVCWCRLVVNKI